MMKIIKATKAQKKQIFEDCKQLHFKLNESIVACKANSYYPKYSVEIQCSTIESAQHVHRLLIKIMEDKFGEVQIY